MSEKFEMRELTGGDIFTMIGIIGKLDIKDQVTELVDRQFSESSKSPLLQGFNKKKLTKAEKEAEETAIEKRGMKVAVDLGFTLIQHIGDAKADINNFLADLTGSTKKQIESLNMVDYTSLIFQFVKKEELKDFFQSISSLLG
ncbi:hypothetical protein [Streptococcus dysgalactiae]|uniref:Uncharacterized protein n=1 Tax=Streptococcus dysgalactiae subsp. equisimilis TaxID=119602 RepID=A0AAE9QTT3_STREQ|nr:hypothetical protein [Streptococcus dysgalactiae]SQG92622.1 Uncharacterised protein [Streptococcus dysgalactiae subsp. equisimilis]VTT16037.1 Uncharacterised protein [Streptococcus dysgalactiae]VTT25697.1 Uncharacterised protein [Streptococcus dysgalactiae subsp. equisimilis]